MFNPNSKARKIIALAPASEPLPKPVGIEIAAWAVMSSVLVDNDGNPLLDATQGQTPVITSPGANTYNPQTGQLVPGGAGARTAIAGIPQLTSDRPAFAATTATFSSGATTISVASATGLVAGQSLIGAGIPTGTLISSITGTAPVLSVATTAAATSEAVTSGIGAAGTMQSTATGLGMQYANYAITGATAGSATGVSLAAGTGATAGTVTITSTTITAIAVSTGGTGYINGATVVISGNGSGATATATVVNGVITAFVMTAVGTGYSGSPTVTVYPNSVATGSGSWFNIFNASGTTITVYGGYNDAINSGAAGAGISLPAGQTALMFDEAANQWSFFSSGNPGSYVNAQTGTTYTVQSSDAGAVVDITNSGGITVTLPNNLPVGFTCELLQGGAGQITCSAASGGTLTGWKTFGAPPATGATKTAGEYAVVKLRVTANTTGTAAAWNISGQTA